MVRHRPRAEFFAAARILFSGVIAFFLAAFFGLTVTALANEQSNPVLADVPSGLFRVKAKAIPTPTVPEAPIQLEPVTATLTAVAAVAAASGVATSVAVAASSPNGFMTFLQALLPFISLRKRQPPWGRVVENGTGRPIKGALISIFDADGRPRQTSMSRADGSFGTLLPAGSYQLKIQYEGFELATAAPDILLFPGERLYDGKQFMVSGHEDLVPIVVPIDPIVPSWRTDYQGVSWWATLRVWQARYATTVLLIGAVGTTLTLLRTAHAVIIGIAAVYVVFLTLELLLSRVSKRMIGLVSDSVTKSPVSLALVRLTDYAGRRVMATEVTLPRGHFLIVPEPGDYQLHVIHPNYEPYIDKKFHVSKWSARVDAVKVALVKKRSQRPGRP